jgi:hypothetical protein
MIFNLFRPKRQPRGRSFAKTLRAYDRQKVEEGWEKIEQLILVGRPSAMKEAVIAADKLLDYALTQISSGETMGERLKNARASFPPPTYQGLWDAHKMRNALVHETDFDLTQLVAREVLGKFKAGFRVLGVDLK